MVQNGTLNGFFGQKRAHSDFDIQKLDALLQISSTDQVETYGQSGLNISVMEKWLSKTTREFAMLPKAPAVDDPRLLFYAAMQLIIVKNTSTKNQRMEHLSMSTCSYLLATL